MAKKARPKKRRRRRGGGRRGGVMMGMRSGIRNVAATASGKSASKRSNTVVTLITIALVIGAAALLLSR